MSWHPYDPKRPLWTVYWGERPSPQTDDPAANVVEFEMTEPYSLNRDDWRLLQINLLAKLTPPDYTLNISQLWSRLWPSDGAVLFSKMNDVYKLPIALSAQLDTPEQPGKRKDFFWVLVQTKPDLDRLNDIIFYQGIDLENITWITEEPIAPWPGQLFEYNRAAFARNRRLLSVADFDQVIRHECWGFTTTHLGSLDFLTTRARRDPESLMALLQEEAAKFELEVEFIPFAQRPHKPGLLTTLGKLPGNLLHDGWNGLKARQHARR